MDHQALEAFRRLGVEVPAGCDITVVRGVLSQYSSKSDRL
jgi:hypothetical protein